MKAVPWATCKRALSDNPFDAAFLQRRAANHVALSPVSFLHRNMELYPHRIASIHGNNTALQLTWQQTGERAARLASGLQKTFGLRRNDVVSIIAPNTAEMYDAHFAMPGSGIVLHTINTRLDATTIAYQLRHADAKVVLVDTEYSKMLGDVKALLQAGGDGKQLPRFVSVQDPGNSEHNPADQPQGLFDLTYSELLEQGSSHHLLSLCKDEFDAIALNYTSGTTGNPKGVVSHHRGAYLNAVSHAMEWHMRRFASYLWVVPMFHCNGWCFPWTLAAVSGTNFFMRQVRAPIMIDLIKKYNIEYMAGAPIVMDALLDSPNRIKFQHTVRMWTGGAPPPASTMNKLRDEMNIHVDTIYGLTEVYGPVTAFRDNSPADHLSAQQLKLMNAPVVQSKDAMQEDVQVLDPGTMKPVRDDGKTMGEVMVRGNLVMKGYLKNPSATEEAFEGGWFRTGDIAVSYGRGRFELRDRSKDIIISGGENISSIEVENIMHVHPHLRAVAVVAMPHEKWGEVPAAFVVLHKDAPADSSAADEQSLIAWCKKHMPSFQAPKKIIYTDELPKTATGKVQKNELRKQFPKTW